LKCTISDSVIGPQDSCFFLAGRTSRPFVGGSALAGGVDGTGSGGFLEDRDRSADRKRDRQWRVLVDEGDLVALHVDEVALLEDGKLRPAGDRRRFSFAGIEELGRHGVFLIGAIDRENDEHGPFVDGSSPEHPVAEEPRHVRGGDQFLHRAASSADRQSAPRYVVLRNVRTGVFRPWRTEIIEEDPAAVLVRVEEHAGTADRALRVRIDVTARDGSRRCQLQLAHRVSAAHVGLQTAALRAGHPAVVHAPSAGAVRIMVETGQRALQKIR
jgi:hypothetical protein